MPFFCGRLRRVWGSRDWALGGMPVGGSEHCVCRGMTANMRPRGSAWAAKAGCEIGAWLWRSAAMVLNVDNALGFALRFIPQALASGDYANMAMGNAVRVLHCPSTFYLPYVPAKDFGRWRCKTIVHTAHTICNGHVGTRHGFVRLAMCVATRDCETHIGSL